MERAPYPPYGARSVPPLWSALRTPPLWSALHTPHVERAPYPPPCGARMQKGLPWKAPVCTETY